MKSLKNTLQESLRIGINDQPEFSVDELVDEYLKPHFNKEQTVTFPTSKFNIKYSCHDRFIEKDILSAISDDPNIENELNDLWQEMIKYKLYHFGFNDDMPKLLKKEVQYIYDFIQKITDSLELTNLYKSCNFAIDIFESNKYIFFKIHNTSCINIWIAEK